MPDPDGTRSDVNGDFRPQGYAHLTGGLFPALPSGRSMSRTGVAVSAGARTRWAGVVSGVFLALVVLLCGPLAERIPTPVVGGLLLVMGGELIRGKRHDILLVLRASGTSADAMVLAFLTTAQLPLQQAIILGAVLSLPLYCARAALQAKLVALVRADDGHGGPPNRLPPPPGEVTVLDYAGSSFFAEPPRIEARFPRPDGARGAVLVPVVRALPDVPSSAMIKLLDRYGRHLGDQDGRLVLCGVRPSLAHLLQSSGAPGPPTASVAAASSPPPPNSSAGRRKRGRLRGRMSDCPITGPICDGSRLMFRWTDKQDECGNGASGT
ncbi:hypothetical protein SNE510_72870 [Streptomyces sp. NE5-10]|nr:hypothetical protein SNE510_72870 [Streptomyces sp. NE5-10]